MKIYLPIRTKSESNLREHWAKRGRRVKKQRANTRMLVASAIMKAGPAWMRNPGKLDIHLVRIAPRRLDDGNLGISFKAIQDGIADAIGIDDGDRRLHWHYDQRKGKPKEYAVEVEITAQQENGE